MKKLRWPLASPRRVAKLFVVGFPPLLACRAKVRESMICQDPGGSLHIQRTSFVMFHPQLSHHRRDMIRLTMTSIRSPAHSGKTPSALVVLSPTLAAVAGSNESPFTFLSNVSNAGNEDENEDESSDTIAFVLVRIWISVSHSSATVAQSESGFFDVICWAIIYYHLM